MLDFLYRALASRFGIVVETSNVNLARARMYKARADAGDPDLDRLQFRPDHESPTSRLWIIKGEDPNATIEQPERTEAHPPDGGEMGSADGTVQVPGAEP